MKRFKYKSLLVSDEDNFLSALNVEGAQGWEVMFVERDYASIRFWLKREVHTSSADLYGEVYEP